MLLQACLLLLIVTADTALASSHHPCGGNVSLDREVAGHINLTAPGPFCLSNTATIKLDSATDRSDETPPVSVCTWTISIPPGRAVLLKLLWLESGSSVTVHCLEKDKGRALAIDGSTLLSNCSGHKASLSWTGEGHSSNPIALSYNIQEDERNSSGDHADASRADRDPVRWTQTGSSFASLDPVVRGTVGGTEWGKGRLHEGAEEWTSGPSLSSEDRGLLHDTSHAQRFTMAGNADRETLSLPEEVPNNGADASGATHRADGSMYTRDGSHPYFEPTLSTESPFHTSHPTKAETDFSERLTESRTLPKLGTTVAPDATMVTDTHKHRDSLKLDSSATQGYQTVANPNLVSPLSDTPSWGTREGRTILGAPGGAAASTPKEAPQHFWRGQRSTDRLNSELTSAITLNPSPLLPGQQQDGTSPEPTGTESTSSSSSFPNGPSMRFSSTAEPTGAPHHLETASLTPQPTQNGLGTDATVPSNNTEAPDGSEGAEGLHTLTFSAPTLTDSPETTRSTTLFTTSREQAHDSTQSHSVNMYVSPQTVYPVSNSRGIIDRTTTRPSLTTDAGPVVGIQNSVTTETLSGTKTEAPLPTYTSLNKLSTTNSPTSSPRLSSSATTLSSPPSHTAQAHSPPPASPTFTHSSSPLPLTTTQSPGHVTVNHKSPTVILQTSISESASSHTLQTQSTPPSPSSSLFPIKYKKNHNVTSPDLPPVLPVTTVISERDRQDVGVTKEATVKPQVTLQPSEESRFTPTASVLTSTWSSTSRPKPKFYIVPDQPADIKVEMIELLLQIVVEESNPASARGLEEDATVWVKSHLQGAPGFSRLLEVWSSGHAVQCLLEFKTSGALRWLGVTGPTSLLERTGMAQPGTNFGSTRIVNVTLGGVQADVCDWLLECPAGYKCTARPGSSNYSCSSYCHLDYCHHHGICTHHQGQLPVCHCQAGEDTWYMGHKCDVRMTRARLAAACLAVLLVLVAVIGALAFLAVRRYRALLIQAKVDQTRSSYRRFNHFDELSGRFWLRSWAESADSLDNPAFTRSDELLHLRALDRPCCYHDDTLSLASTCPSHGARINTIYPHSSQYAWRGSGMSVGDGVLDSGKASDLSVCSWPVEPIQWTPFPLLQQLAASHRAPSSQVRVSRPRSYCEGMELVDIGKSWTA